MKTPFFQNGNHGRPDTLARRRPFNDFEAENVNAGQGNPYAQEFEEPRERGRNTPSFGRWMVLSLVAAGLCFAVIGVTTFMSVMGNAAAGMARVFYFEAQHQVRAGLAKPADPAGMRVIVPVGPWADQIVVPAADYDSMRKRVERADVVFACMIGVLWLSLLGVMWKARRLRRINQVARRTQLSGFFGHAV